MNPSDEEEEEVVMMEDHSNHQHLTSSNSTEAGPVLQQEDTAVHTDIAADLPPPPLLPPAVHGYLGLSLQAVERSAPLEEGSIVSLPLILLRGVVLFPSEALPLRFFSLDHIRLVQSFVQDRGDDRDHPIHLGILNTKRMYSSLLSLGRMYGHNQPTIDLYENVGSTAEISSINNTDGNEASEGGIVKAIGRHRFRVLPPSTPDSQGNCHSCLPFFPVCFVSHLLLPPNKLLSLSFYLSTAYTVRNGVMWARCLILKEASVPSLMSILPVSSQPLRHLARSSNRHQITHWSPRHVMARSCPYELMRKAKAILKSVAAWEGISRRGGNSDDGEDIAVIDPDEDEGEPNGSRGEEGGEEEDPVAFSYRLAANLPLEDIARQRLLSAENVVYRLRQEIKLLQTGANKALCCSVCKIPLAQKSKSVNNNLLLLRSTGT